MLLTNMNSGHDVIRLIKRSYLKYYNGMEWECMYTLGINTVKNMQYIKNSSK